MPAIAQHTADPAHGVPLDAEDHLIEELAVELKCGREVVARVYRDEVDGLARDARLLEFIPVFAARRTRERLRRRRER